jgi:hypothetical protein
VTRGASAQGKFNYLPGDAVRTLLLTKEFLYLGQDIGDEDTLLGITASCLPIDIRSSACARMQGC